MKGSAGQKRLGCNTVCKSSSDIRILKRCSRGTQLAFKVVLTTVAVVTVLWASQFLVNSRRQSLSFSGNVAGQITWSSCPHGTVKNVECGSIWVPKDYFNLRDGGHASIAFAVYRATKTPKKGSVFLNPGGPGGSGLGLAAIGGPMYAEIIGHEWDLVGFDPRGIGSSKPAVQCFPDFMTFQPFLANTVIESGITVPPISNISSPFFREELVRQYRQFLALQKAQAELCAKTMGDELRFMGTANVVRDLDFMTRVFEGDDAKINLHGSSYGSVLGMWLVNMLPTRIGHVVIDGIVDPLSWSGEPTHLWAYNWLSSAEETYEIFLKDCAEAGPPLCPLAHDTDEPWQNIEKRLERFIDQLVMQPLSVPDARRPGYLTSGTVRGMLLFYLMRPSAWPSATQVLASAMSSDGTAMYNALIADYKHELPGLTRVYDLSRQAVTCLDSPQPQSPADFPTAEDLADQGIKTLKEISRHFGVSAGVSEHDGGCQYWPARGPERFTGPWNASLEVPMLVVSNTADPITPIASGVLISSLMPHSSSLVIQEGPGHTSFALPSLCMAKLKRAYFSGDIPHNGTTCKAEMKTFPKDEDDIDSLSTTAIEDDRRLLDAVRWLGKYYMEG